MLSVTDFAWSFDGTDRATQLLSVLGNLTYARTFLGNLRLRAQGGAGTLVLFGVDEGNPLLLEGLEARRPIVLAHFRVAFGIEYQLGSHYQLIVNPLVWWYSPGLDAFALGVDSLSGLQSMAGASYQF
jgi:hypothetical protein